jgi:hypothetical protein
MMLTDHANRTRKLSTPLVLALVTLGVAAVALTFGGALIDFAKFGAPHNVALQAAQIGLGGPAQAAPVAIEAGYLPARLAVQAHESEPLPDQF